MQKLTSNRSYKSLTLTLIQLCLIGVLCQAQNPFNLRSVRSQTNKAPSFETTTIAYSNSQQLEGMPFKLPFNRKDLKILIGQNGAPSMVIGTNSSFGKVALNAHYQVITFLQNNADILPIAKPDDELISNEVTANEDGSSFLKFTRKIYDLEVFGGEINANINSEKQIVLSGKMYTTPENTIKQLVSVKEVEASALEAIGAVEVMPPFDYKWNLAAGFGVETKLYWASVDGKILQKIYVIDYFPNYLQWFRVWVDAHTGIVLRKYTKTCSVDGPKTATATDLNNQSKTINTYQVGSNYYLIDATKPMFSSSRGKLPSNPYGAIWTIDAKNSDGSNLYNISSSGNSWSDKSSVSAHFNAGVAYYYFKNTHGRNSINGQGGTITSVVNVTENGSGLDNAYWNGSSMFYGNGRLVFKPLAGSLDVAGHEMTHGVVSSTANLEYVSQSGAINESMADVFGAMMDRDDWKIGEDVVKSAYYPSGALRDLSNPHNGATKPSQNGYQPQKMSEYYTGTDDNEGVHTNSGIPNHAYYLFASAITKEKAEKVYYRALANYLTSSSDFLDLRYAVIQAATDLHGASSAEVAKAKEAFDAVEIYDPNAGSGSSGNQDDLPKNNGSEFIICVDVDPTNTNTLYQSSTSGTGFKALSKTDVLRRPCLVDDGSYCIFVADDNNIHKITLKGTIKETILTSDGFWENAAISRDGKRLAGVSTEVDSAIYVYDFITQKWSTFKLYNPTYSTGINSGGVLYADALEFDYSGEYILYDARTKTKGASGVDLDYWDIGIIRVWDNVKNTWGDGKVKKLFSQLPADVSIGNPTYAKNSPYIIGFDYIDEYASTISVLALNTATGKTGTIYDNAVLGYPSFSNLDDKVLFNATSSGNNVVGVRSISADKITGTGTATLVIDEAKWGVWYADGTRQLLSQQKDLLSFSFPGLSGAPSGSINGTSITVEVPAGSNLNSLVASFTSSSKSIVLVSNTQQVSNVSANNFSNKVVYTVMAEDKSTKNYTVTVTTKAVSVHQPQLSAMVLYPNPAGSQLYITGLTDRVSYSIYAVDGKRISSGLLFPKKAIDVAEFSAGLYYIHIVGVDSETITRPFIKK